MGPQAAVLLLIGTGWALAAESGGPLRLEDPNDPVRIELEKALARGAKIFPVLLENARMPPASEVPEHLRVVVDLTALRLRDSDWGADLDAIVRALVKAGFRLDSPAAPAPHRFPRKAIWSMGCLIFGLVALAKPPTRMEDLYVTPTMSAIALLLAVLGWRDTSTPGLSLRWLNIGLVAVSALVLLGGIGRGISNSQRHDPPTPLPPTWRMENTETDPSIAGPAQPPPPSPAHHPSTVPAFHETPHQAHATRPEPPVPLSVLGGQWQDNNGVVMKVQVHGDSFRVNAFGANGYRSWGEGRVNGRSVEWKFQTNLPSIGSGRGTLSADGHRMDGEFQDSRMGHQRESFVKM
jgi:hypothetical protein